jgi:CDP-glucose 4,6-dehydratase
VEAPVLRLDASEARRRLGWAPRWDARQALDATREWHDAVRAGADARELTLAQIEG